MFSDNLISVREIPATEAARNFSEVLDAVEHRGEEFTIRRRGKLVAKLMPMDGGSTLATLSEILKRHPADEDYWKDIREVRALLVDRDIPWPD
jgi:prevent-host-death family protein